MARELTLAQREPLFQLVRHERESEEELVFGLTGGWKSGVFVFPNWEEEDIILRLPCEVVMTWAEHGYVSMGQRDMGTGQLTTFLLLQNALDYERWMRRPRLVRSVITAWRGIVEDVPSVLWGVVGGVLGSIATTLVRGWLKLP